MDSRQAAISCRNLGVNFPIDGSGETFQALTNVNLDITDGEAVGLLGNNGAGKSTLLRTLAGVYIAQSGSLEVPGKISTIFQATVGADPDLSGYENIVLMMAARKIPLSQHKDVVLDAEIFTELGDALKRPFRTYSNGMKLRLAFAIATYQRSDVLLIDEQIGVGDQSFQVKARARISGLITGSGCLVLASHSRYILRTFCNRGLVMDSGQVIFDGDIESAIAFHEKEVEKK